MTIFLVGSCFRLSSLEVKTTSGASKDTTLSRRSRKERAGYFHGCSFFLPKASSSFEETVRRNFDGVACSTVELKETTIKQTPPCMMVELGLFGLRSREEEVLDPRSERS